MNEQVARNVVLVRAIETIDQQREILSEDDRMYASRSAKELAQWQASDTRSEVTAEHFLQQRSEQILKRIAERTPAFAAFLKRRSGGKILAVLAPVLALLLGAGMDRIGDPHRVDLLSAPLLLMLAWNGLVYAGLLVWMFVPASKKAGRDAGLIQRLAAGWNALSRKLPRKLPHCLSTALLSFTSEWMALSAALTNARVSRTLHLSAALFAVGAMLSLYARGFLSQYVAGWESTFLDAAQVHALLSKLFMPAMSILGLPGFSIFDIEVLRFSASTPALGGARWVHLYAATLFLLVVLPRMILTFTCQWKARRLERHFPLDLESPYFRKLGAKFGDMPGAAPSILRVLPYSFTLDEARDRGLSAVAAEFLGEQARVMLRPSVAYGEEIQLALGDINLNDENVALTAVLFNLSATPEKENHGAFLDYLARHAPRAMAVLIDESGYLERIGSERIATRIALWREFCHFHHQEATIVNLLAPAMDPPGGRAP
jgi:hypothetical protein